MPHVITLKYYDGVNTVMYQGTKSNFEPLAHAIERLTDLAEADGWTDAQLEDIIYIPEGAKNNG